MTKKKMNDALKNAVALGLELGLGLKDVERRCCAQYQVADSLLTSFAAAAAATVLCPLQANNVALSIKLRRFLSAD